MIAFELFKLNFKHDGIAQLLKKPNHDLKLRKTDHFVIIYK